MTLSQIAFGADSLLKKTLLVVAGTMFIAIAAQIAVPLYPVPATFQTLAILIIGLSFGARLGAITVLAYLLEGAAGLPVFANGGAGLAYMAGPTAGFLLGFVALAYVAGLAAGRGFVAMLVASLVASVVLYIPGVAWPMYLAELFAVDAKWVGSSAVSIWAYWVSPFVLLDAIKALVAVMVVAGGLKLLRK